MEICRTDAGCAPLTAARGNGGHEDFSLPVRAIVLVGGLLSSVAFDRIPMPLWATEPKQIGNRALVRCHG
jgi:hypothetical protein